MKVFKCDRCGNIYDEQKKDAVYLVKKFSYINKNVSTSGTYTYIDLCDSCLAELNDWMEGSERTDGGVRMTNKEKAIVMAYTGVCMLTGDKFQIYHEYVEDIMGRPVMTHELGSAAMMKEIKARSMEDFMKLCAGGDSTSESLDR